MLIVEDGTIIFGAEAYITVAYADDYFLNHNSPVQWSGLTTPQKESAIRYATLYLEAKYTFKGSIQDTDQSLSFPRTAFYDNNGRQLAGFGVIPTAIKVASAELALRHVISDLFLDTTVGQDKIFRERLGPREIQTQRNEATSSDFSVITNLLKPYLDHSPNYIPVYRG